jgi:hypothetical protein
LRANPEPRIPNPFVVLAVFQSVIGNRQAPISKDPGPVGQRAKLSSASVLAHDPKGAKGIEGARFGKKNEKMDQTNLTSLLQSII